MEGSPRNCPPFQQFLMRSTQLQRRLLVTIELRSDQQARQEELRRAPRGDEDEEENRTLEIAGILECPKQGIYVGKLLEPG